MRSKLPVNYNRDPIFRTNSGYWDGVADRERGQTGPRFWNKPSVYRCAHPFDQLYGKGYWIGFYDEPAPKGAKI